ncbi:hypothetical protein Vsou_15230 [Vulcanisaeta souniana JCM 11219]|uniref:Uncharacterized protein n=1 Tax=Vulcanisaeta souniana JCM 11219 TaxID=1293586 RepID=A0ABN6SRG5_9CREN|nr:hypothetical protein Vsou_15230 [Vulcanisaeta souniana JCM 11219]
MIISTGNENIPILKYLTRYVVIGKKVMSIYGISIMYADK